MPVVAFRAPARRRLHEDVAEQLRDAILDGRFRAGTKLPPERELALEFRVNRTSARSIFIGVCHPSSYSLRCASNHSRR